MRTDNGGEFELNVFKDFCKICGIARQYTVFYSSVQNGVAERRNRSVQNIVRFMLKQVKLFLVYWGEVIMTVNYFYNRLFCKAVNGKTLFEFWCGRKSVIQYLRIFGFSVYVYVFKEKFFNLKLSDRAVKMIFIGYIDGVKAYKLFDSVIYRVQYARSVVFNEEELLFISVFRVTVSVGDDSVSVEDIIFSFQFSFVVSVSDQAFLSDSG